MYICMDWGSSLKSDENGSEGRGGGLRWLAGDRLSLTPDHRMEHHPIFNRSIHSFYNIQK